MRTNMILKNNKGVTLIELMIVMVIAAILVGGVYTLFATQQRSYFVQDRVAGIQQDARAALAIMAKEIRMAGFLTGPGSGTGFANSVPVGIYNYAVEPTNGGSNNPDEITIVLATGSFATLLSVNGQRVTLSSGSSVQPNDFIAFEDDKQVYKVLQIDFPNDGDIKLDDVPPTHLVTIGAQAYSVQAITYRINGASLEKAGNPLAGDGATTVVEDLQFAYQVEGDTSNWYNTPGDAGATNADIRAVRINIIVRTAVPDPEDTTFTQPSLEDHTGSLAGPDGFRRRVYTTVVKVRNL